MLPFILVLMLTVPSLFDLFLISIIIRPRWWKCILIWCLITLSRFFLGGIFFSLLATDTTFILSSIILLLSFGVVEFLFLYYSLKANQKKAIAVCSLTQISILVWYYLSGYIFKGGVIFH